MLESIVNDKMRYAAERSIEEMCKNEPYRLHPLGERKDLPGIDPETLTASYQEWLQQASMDLYVVGDTTLEEEAVRGDKEVETVVERLNVNQGKLNMGLQSLAYYASSRYDGHKGIATIQSGIEIPNYEKAVKIIKQQLDEMKNGNITDLEMSQTKAMIRNLLREMQDSAFELIAYDFNRQLSGKERTAEELLAQVEQISKENVREAAEKFRLDTIYFLRDEKEE
ncbi:hypothetical protein G195_000660 [Phytophthora kernoviae 00238/432]|uniref:Peptidase M16 C-terminal domain-containing protein n=1 Tax=Phytophthora kernoviae 00238/432 TaxID=1284355 RepID=A0A8J4SVT0_9STRA|nr:hypothetical protein G195_000660 [Phytophthora kernoviae 00238/432]